VVAEGPGGQLPGPRPHLPRRPGEGLHPSRSDELLGVAYRFVSRNGRVGGLYGRTMVRAFVEKGRSLEHCESLLIGNPVPKPNVTCQVGGPDDPIPFTLIPLLHLTPNPPCTPLQVRRLPEVSACLDQDLRDLYPAAYQARLEEVRGALRFAASDDLFCMRHRVIWYVSSSAIGYSHAWIEPSGPLPRRLPGPPRGGGWKIVLRRE
jgi:hypothetical protein